MPCIQNIVRAILQWSKKLCILACKRDPMVRDWDIWFSVPRRDRDLPTFPRDRDVWKLRLETVSWPRRRDRDYIPGSNTAECTKRLPSICPPTCCNCVACCSDVLTVWFSLSTVSVIVFEFSTAMCKYYVYYIFTTEVPLCRVITW